MKKVEKLFQKWLDSKNLTRIGYRYYDVVNWDGAEPEERFYSELKLKEAFIAGFNTDKRHYPSKGEYPPSGEEVLCWLWGTTPDVGCWSEKDELWHFDEFEEETVECWQYIIPPKEQI